MEKSISITPSNTNENRKRLKKNPSRATLKNREKALRKADRRFKIVSVLMSLVLMGILFGITFFRNYKLVEKRKEYNRLNNEIISIENERDRLKAELEEAIDINKIQRYALEEMGMVYSENKLDVASRN